MKLKKRIKQNEIDIDRIDVETVRLDKNYETAAQTPAADPSTITTTSTDIISVNEATTAAIQRHFTTWCFFIFFQTYESGTMKKSTEWDLKMNITMTKVTLGSSTTTMTVTPLPTTTTMTTTTTFR